MRSRITYQGHGQDHVTIELGLREAKRESIGDRHCVDAIISRALAIDCPLKLTASVRTDGSVVECSAAWKDTDNTYWHLDCGSDDDATGKYGLPRKQLTQAQRETLVRIWGGEVKPFGVGGSCGADVMSWVAAGPGEIKAILGRSVSLTAPCGDGEDCLASGRRREEDDDSMRRESYLDQAVEEGQISGASAADL